MGWINVCWTCDKVAWVICVTGGCRGDGGLKTKDSIGMAKGSKVVSSAVLEAVENGLPCTDLLKLWLNFEGG